MHQQRKRLLTIALILAAVLGVASHAHIAQAAGGKTTGPKAGALREQDAAAIKKAMQRFLQDFESGNAKAVAAHWTTNGEYIADDGTKYQGREQLAKLYAEFFKKNKDLKVTVETESLRFPSSATAVAEGYLKRTTDKPGLYVTSKFSILHVKEDGQWLMAIVREWPSEGASLRDVDWLVGTWRAKTDAGEVLTTYQWDEGKAFLLARFTIKEKNRTLKGKQIIARDPATGLLRSWTFEAAGGFGEAVWGRDGKKWVLDASGVLADGSRLTATNLLTPVDEHTFLWQAVNRTLDEEELPDLPPIRVTRVKGEK